MGMVVQHNLNAMTAYNKLNTNVAGLKKSSEKLASGYRINRAGDDAAGLAISEKMRSQIKGLNQAVRNSQDGINMIQTYEGAAQETHNILQRMKELASESANGTYDNTTDRDAIELEFKQLNDELNQIADTDFNGRVALNGGKMADGTVVNNNGATAIAQNITYVQNGEADSTLTYKGNVRGSVDAAGNGSINVDGVNLEIKAAKTVQVGATADTVEVGDTTYKAEELTIKPDGTGFDATKAKITATTAVRLDPGKDTTVTIYGQSYNIKWDTDVTKSKLVDETGKEIAAADANAIGLDAVPTFKADGSAAELTFVRTYKVAADGAVTTDKGSLTAGKIDITKGVSVSDAYNQATRNLTYAKDITLQTGARSKDAVDFTFAYTTSGIGDLNADLDISARGLGTSQLSLITQEKANHAIDHIDNAINKVSMVRATFGSMQNRLEHKIDNLTTTSTNLSEAESNIRDTDMASEMMNYTKYNILQQAAQSMLAQANQQPQSILQLLG